MKRLLLSIFIFLFLAGCSALKTEYITPTRYYAEVSINTYHNPNGQEIKYSLKILQKDNEYKIIINYNNVNFFVQFNDGKCTLINDKFPDNKIVTKMSTLENLFKDLNLDKFNGVSSLGPNTVEAYDSEYKYILQYDKSNFAPQKLSIYKNNSIIKVFEYKNVELYRH
jgi:hypothetical protein